MTDAATTPASGVSVDSTIPAGGPVQAPTDAPASSDDAIRKALADNGISDLPSAAGVTDQPEPVADKEPAKRGEDGKFAAKEPKADKPAEKPADKPADDAKAADQEAKAEPAPKSRVAAPDRFNDLAKADWDKVPEPVQAEVSRMQRELEKGIGEYKAKVTEIEARDEPLREYREMADKAGVKFEDAIRSYVAAEKALHENPAQALAQMAQQYMPGGLEAFARAVLGQEQPQADPRDQQIAQLQQQIAQLNQGVQRTTQTIEQQQAAQAAAERQALVDQFAAANPRATEPEVEAEMTRLLASGYVPRDLPMQDRLSQAYEAATRLIPAAAPEPAPQVEPAQTRVTTSISGAPQRGSTPPQEQAPASTDEAIEAALRRYRIA